MSKVTKVLFREFCEPTEIDLREEISDILNGTCLEIPKAYTVLHRKFRLDDRDRLVSCQCNRQEEGQKHKRCSICLGEGYLWDEVFVHTFKVEKSKDRKNYQAGVAYVKEAVFYFEYNVEILKGDLIIEMKIDKEGNPVKPYKRGGIWKVINVDLKRSDKGRTEFLTVTCGFQPVRKNSKRGYESN